MGSSQWSDQNPGGNDTKGMRLKWKSLLNIIIVAAIAQVGSKVFTRYVQPDRATYKVNETPATVQVQVSSERMPGMTRDLFNVVRH